MQKFNGYEDSRKNADLAGGPKLPAGAYVCKVLGVRYEAGENGNSDRIAIQFDIAEGDQKDFFKNQYEANTSEDKKWKGKTAVYIPKDDGSESDGWTKNTFAKWTKAFEDSNSGYTWDWDENKWKGLEVGIVFGETGTVIENKPVVYTEARFAIPTSQVREGKAPTAKFKSKNDYESAIANKDTGFMSVSGTTEEVPW